MSAIYDIAGTTSDSFMLNGKTTLLQGDEAPQPHQGLNGDYYFKSDGSLYAKKNGTWVNLTSTGVPDASGGVNKMIYSDGEVYKFANVKVDENGDLIANIKQEVPAGQTTSIVTADMAGSDIFKISVGGNTDQGWVELATGDNGNEAIYVRQYNGNTIVNELTLLDSNGNTNIPHNLSVGGNLTVSGSATGIKPSATNSTTSAALVTAGWVNDPAYSTNVVHRTGNETVGGQKTFTSGIKVSSLGSLPGQLIAQSADYGFIVRNDNSNTYFLLTNQSDKDGSWNSLRPMYINNSTGNVNCNTVWTFSQTIQGTAYRAQWGDLAEYYEADEHYMPGTLVKFGGSREVTIANDEANAVVTSNPAVIMNGNQSFEHPCPIALVGRVPVKVIGKCNKFDSLVLSNNNGVATVKNSRYDLGTNKVIAKALEEKTLEETSLVLCAVTLSLS